MSAKVAIKREEKKEHGHEKKKKHVKVNVCERVSVGTSLAMSQCSFSHGKTMLFASLCLL